MGELEPVTDQIPYEVGLVIEVIAKTQTIADTVCSFARSTLLHFGYPGRLSTAGNLAFPYPRQIFLMVWSMSSVSIT